MIRQSVRAPGAPHRLLSGLTEPLSSACGQAGFCARPGGACDEGVRLRGGLARAGRQLPVRRGGGMGRSEEHTSELPSPCNLVCRLLLEKKKNINRQEHNPTSTHIYY